MSHFFLILLPFLMSVRGFAGSSCSELFSLGHLIPRQLVISQQSWDLSNFTSPSRHDDGKFQYIVHAGPNVVGVGVNPFLAFMNFLRQHDFNRDGFFSASVVAEAHTGTFSRFGVILSVPKEKVMEAVPQDMRSTYQDTISPKNYLDGWKEGRLPSPSELVGASNKGTGFFNFDLFGWNEVFVYGKAQSTQRIQVTGVFAHKDSLGVPILRDSNLKLLQDAANDMKVPLILLPPPQGKFILAVRMSGTREAPLLRDYGPEKIEFLARQEEIKLIFAQAKEAGELVRIVDETRGPKAALAGESLFAGIWRDRSEVDVEYSADLDATPPIKIKFQND